MLDSSFKAVVNLTNMPDQVEHLKRLALIFDEIYYVYPQLYCIEDMSLIDPAGNFHIEDFFGSCVLHDVLTLPDLQETLSIFEEAKIVKGISARDEVLEHLRQKSNASSGISLRFLNRLSSGWFCRRFRSLITWACFRYGSSH